VVRFRTMLIGPLLVLFLSTALEFWTLAAFEK
jgi:hypothetical protein